MYIFSKWWNDEIMKWWNDEIMKGSEIRNSRMVGSFQPRITVTALIFCFKPAYFKSYFNHNLQLNKHCTTVGLPVWFTSYIFNLICDLRQINKILYWDKLFSTVNDISVATFSLIKLFSTVNDISVATFSLINIVRKNVFLRSAYYFLACRMERNDDVM